MIFQCQPQPSSWKAFPFQSDPFTLLEDYSSQEDLSQPSSTVPPALSNNLSPSTKDGGQVNQDSGLREGFPSNTLGIDPISSEHINQTTLSTTALGSTLNEKGTYDQDVLPSSFVEQEDYVEDEFGAFFILSTTTLPPRDDLNQSTWSAIPSAQPLRDEVGDADEFGKMAPLRPHQHDAPAEVIVAQGCSSDDTEPSEESPVAQQTNASVSKAKPNKTKTARSPKRNRGRGGRGRGGGRGGLNRKGSRGYEDGDTPSPSDRCQEEHFGSSKREAVEPLNGSPNKRLTTESDRAFMANLDQSAQKSFQQVPLALTAKQRNSNNLHGRGDCDSSSSTSDKPNGINEGVEPSLLPKNGQQMHCKPRGGTENNAAVESVEAFETTANENQNSEAGLPPKDNTTFGGDRRASVLEDEPRSHSQLQLELEDPRLGPDEEELLVVTQATTLIRGKSVHFGQVASELHAEIVNLSKRNVTLENTKSETADALRNAEMRLKTIEEQMSTARTAVEQEDVIKESLQQSMALLEKAKVEDKRSLSLRDLIVEQDKTITLKQAEEAEIGKKWSSVREEVKLCEENQTAAVQDYEKGLEKMESMESRHKAAIDKKTMWDFAARITQAGPLNLWCILSSQYSGYWKG